MPYTKEGEFWETPEELAVLAEKQWRKLMREDAASKRFALNPRAEVEREAAERRHRTKQRAVEKINAAKPPVLPAGRPSKFSERADEIILDADNVPDAVRKLENEGLLGDLMSLQVKNRRLYLLRKGKKALR